MNERKLIAYHANCSDGHCCAWLMSKAFPDAEFVPVSYGGEELTGYENRDVFILDFSYPRAKMLDIIDKCNSLIVLDHHKTAEQELIGLESPKALIHFDMKKSVGQLTWEWRKSIEGIIEKPWIVDYTADRDLWLWKLPFSKEINSALRSYPMTFESWNTLANRRAHDLIGEGQAIQRMESQFVANAVKSAWEIEIDGHKVLCTNAVGSLVSEIGGELAKGRPFGATFFVNEKQKIWSLRSREGGVDVSEIAKRRGGGGHRAAAGFQEDLK
jgi:uncharacterized protein